MSRAHHRVRAAAIVLSLGACAPPAPTHAIAVPAEAPEVAAPVMILALGPPLDQRRAELSGLAWYGDDLVLLPQYPDRFKSKEGGALFTLPKSALRDRIDGRSQAPLEPRQMPFDSGGLEDRIDGFDGFEAITFDGDRVFLTIEARPKECTVGYLVRGAVVDGRVVLDPKSLVTLTPPVAIPNLAYEALTRFEGSLLTFYEANGRSIVQAPVARRFNEDLVELAPLPLAPIDYRITDASSVDAAGRFWVTNYYWPGEPRLARAEDDAKARATPVEQLVELRVSDGRVTRTPRAPLRLALEAKGRSRNWEGLVRFDDRGFLLATDEHPETLLAFVAYPVERPSPR